MRLVIVVPALVNCEKHLEMVRVQSLLCDRLRQRAGAEDLEVHSCIIFDSVDRDLLRGVLELPFSMKFFGAQLYPDAGPPSGIRRPFEHALCAIGKIFDSDQPTWVLRMIQDVFIDDAGQLFDSLRALAVRPGQFLAGESAGCANIHEFLDELEIPRESFYRYIQGAVMFARLDVWLQHYPRLPAAITHFCDDSVISQMVTHAGGELLRVPRCWRHCHDCEVEESRHIFEAHRAEIG